MYMIKRTLNTQNRRWILFAAIVIWAITPYAWATHIKQHQLVDGLDIYLTVVPAEMIRGYPKDHYQSQMHGGIPTNDHYHLIVTVFNHATRQRITNAQVIAKVISQNYTGPALKLEHMILNGESSYGNYLIVPENEAFNIDLQIQVTDKKEVTKVLFLWGKA